VQGVLDAWSSATDAPESYTAGSAGPSAADALLARDGDRWLEIAPLETLGCSESSAPLAATARG
jgi:glucose-6-phosphate 1-dehydrogenase